VEQEHAIVLLARVNAFMKTNHHATNFTNAPMAQPLQRHALMDWYGIQ